MKKEVKKPVQFNDFLYNLFMSDATSGKKEAINRSGKVIVEEKIVRKKMFNNIYGTPLKKTLHWILPEDQHLYFRQREFSRLYEKMKEDITSDVESYEKKWQNFQKKKPSGFHHSRRANFLAVLRNDYTALNYSFSEAPTFVKETLAVLFSIYIFMFLAASFPSVTNKYITYFFSDNSINQHQVANSVKTEEAGSKNNHQQIISNLSLYFSEYIKKNSDSLRNKNANEVMVEKNDIFGRVAGEEDISE